MLVAVGVVEVVLVVVGTTKQSELHIFVNAINTYKKGRQTRGNSTFV